MGRKHILRRGGAHAVPGRGRYAVRTLAPVSYTHLDVYKRQDEQVERLLDAIRGLPPYVFVMIGLYAGLRREEILALQWDSVYLDTDAPYLTVRRAWHTEHNLSLIHI